MRARSGRLWRGRVHHEPYRFRPAEVAQFSTAPLAWDDLHEPTREPDHACVASGVDVSVFGLREVPAHLPPDQAR